MRLQIGIILFAFTLVAASCPSCHAQATKDPERDAKTLPPQYWAAFVLSGDWR